MSKGKYNASIQVTLSITRWGEITFKWKQQKSHIIFFPVFYSEKSSLGLCELSEYNRAKWGTSNYTEISDKSVSHN